MNKTTNKISRLPDKKYFRIGEVSALLAVDTHVLRYWESEFKIIKPFRGKSKQRLYRRSDVENLHRIKQLLHVEGYTISGARKLLGKNPGKHFADASHCPSLGPDLSRGQIQHIKNELHSILDLLGSSRNITEK